MNQVLLSDVCEINPRMDLGISDDTECSFVPMEYVDDVSGTIAQTDIRRVGDVKKGYTFFRNGDVIFAKITPCMENGKCAVGKNLKNGIAFGSTEFHVIRATDKIIPEWIYYYLRQEHIRQSATYWFRGTAGQQRVPATFLEELKIPLPPLAEQKRIASLLARADRLRQLRRAARQLTDSLLQSVFLEMFGNVVRNEKGWEKAKISDLGKVQTGNTPSREEPENFGDFIEWIKSDNIRDEQLYVSASDEKLSEIGLKKGRTVDAGAVLITCIAGSLEHIGDTSLTNRAVAFNQQINAVLPFNDVNPLFLRTMLQIAKSYVQYNASAGMKHIITKSKLEELVLVKPPLPLQEEFARVAARVEGLRARQAEAERQAAEMFQSLLNQAFCEGVQAMQENVDIAIADVMPVETISTLGAYTVEGFISQLHILWDDEESPKMLHVAEKAVEYQSSISGWLLSLTAEFQKKIKKCDKTIKSRIEDAIREIDRNPIQAKGDTLRPLTHLKGYWRYRIGKYRLIYFPDPNVHRIIFCDFDSRGGIYE